MQIAALNPGWEVPFMVRLFVTLVLLGVGMGMDLKRFRISNRLILAGIGTGILLYLGELLVSIHQGVGISWEELCVPGDRILGFFLPIFLLWIPYKMRGIGAGDIKLFSIIGCINGSRDVIWCILLSFLLAAGISLGRLLSQKQLLSSLMNFFNYCVNCMVHKRLIPYAGREQSEHWVHFAVWIFCGTLLYLGIKMGTESFPCG